MSSQSSTPRKKGQRLNVDDILGAAPVAPSPAPVPPPLPPASKPVLPLGLMGSAAQAQPSPTIVTAPAVPAIVPPAAVAAPAAPAPLVAQPAQEVAQVRLSPDLAAKKPRLSVEVPHTFEELFGKRLEPLVEVSARRGARQIMATELVTVALELVVQQLPTLTDEQIKAAWDAARVHKSERLIARRFTSMLATLQRGSTGT